MMKSHQIVTRIVSNSDDSLVLYVTKICKQFQIARGIVMKISFLFPLRKVNAAEITLSAAV